MNNMELGSRKLHILQSIIDDYIASGEPVGSRTLAHKYGMGLSSATIRNEMADLEDMGYLTQPHTSAGRIPSEKGYRLYVDRLMKVRALSDQEAESIKHLFDERVSRIEQVVHEAGTVLSDITHYTAVMLGPQINRVRIRHIHLVPLDHEQVLMVVVTNSGVIKDIVIRVTGGVQPAFLERISNMLSERYSDSSLGDMGTDMVRDLQAHIDRERDFFNAMVDAFTGTLHNQEGRDVYLGGTANIFNYPEYQDILRARSFLNLMEKRNLLYEMLADLDQEGVSVTIGRENSIEELQEFSVVTASYRAGGRVLGSIGLIGPTRMEYAKAVSALDYVGRSLSQYLTDLLKKE
jgi:heat-inducible transcriptional repressor